MLKKELESSIIYNNIEDDIIIDDDNIFSFDNKIINNPSIISSPIIYNNILNVIEMDEINDEKDKFIHKLMLEELKNKNLIKKNYNLICLSNKLRYNIVLNQLLHKLQLKEINKKLTEYYIGYRLWKSLLS